MDLFGPWGSISQLTKLRPSLLLTLVRHGQSEGNKQRVIQGQSDYPLSELGTAQAQALRSYLDSHGITFDAVYSSDLTRARQTADIVAAGLNITDDRRLRTRHYGQLSRLAPDPGAAPSPGAAPCGGPHLLPLGGETAQEVRQRAADFLRDMCARHLSARCPRLLVITHNWFISELVLFLTEMSGREGEAWVERKTPNTALTELHVAETTDGQMAVTFLKVGSVEHLEDVTAAAVS